MIDKPTSESSSLEIETSQLSDDHFQVKDEYNSSLFWKKIAAMAIGNFMEWFDFATFGALADVIGAQFFPSENKMFQLMKSLSVFGAAFVMRPVGGVAMGWIGDTVGRRRALELSILLMLFPSFLIGCLPTYSQWGWSASALLVFLRLIQGLACGGELVGSFIYTIEATNGIRNGFWGGVCKATGNFGTSSGIAAAAILRMSLSQKDLYSYGWRVPFLISLSFGVVGVYLRQILRDDKEIVDAMKLKKSKTYQPITSKHEYPDSGSQEEESVELKDNQPFKELLLFHGKTVILVVLVASFWGSGYYSTFVWLPFFMTENSFIGEKNIVQQTWLISLCLNMLLVLALPIGGLLGDFTGNLMRNKYKGTISIMQLALCIAGVVIVPAYWVINNNYKLSFSNSNFSEINCRTWIVAIAQLSLCVPLALFGGNLPAFMVSQFQPRFRYSGIGLAYNLSHAIFSGTVPIILTALVLSKHTINESDELREDNDYSNQDINDEQLRYLREAGGTAFAWFDTKQFLPLLPSIYLLSLIMVAAVALAIAKRKEPMK